MAKRILKSGQLFRNFRIARTKAFDLFVHRDRLEREVLFTIVLRDPDETPGGLFFVADAHVEVAQHVQCGKVFQIVCDQLFVFLNCLWDLSQRKILFRRPHNLCFFELHSGKRQFLKRRQWYPPGGCRFLHDKRGT